MAKQTISWHEQNIVTLEENIEAHMNVVQKELRDVQRLQNTRDTLSIKLHRAKHLGLTEYDEDVF
jgi:Tfp pilus assembly protein PilN